MTNINKFYRVDLTMLEDCYQLGQSKSLADLFSNMRSLLQDGYKLVLQRYPVNSKPLCYGIISNVPQFELWIRRFVDGS